MSARTTLSLPGPGVSDLLGEPDRRWPAGPGTAQGPADRSITSGSPASSGWAPVTSSW